MQRISFLARKFFFLLLLPVAYMSCTAQNKEPWTQSQLVEPSVLAKQLDLPAAQRPVIIDVGPAGVIKGALHAGPAEDKENLAKMDAFLQKVPKNREVVIYCGCCPFARCPNVRPAFKELQKLGFTNPRLLNLSDNLKADWIDKGYPLED